MNSQDLDTDDLINLLKGIGIPYGGIEGLTIYSGNQWNEDWVWDEKALRLKTKEELWRLYLSRKQYDAL